SCACEILPDPGRSDQVHRCKASADCARIWRAGSRLTEIGYGIRAIWSAALRDIAGLRSVNNAVDEIQTRVSETNFALFGGEFEIQMVGPLLRIVVGFEIDISAGSDECELPDLIALRPFHWIIAQVAAADIHRQRGRIVNLDEIIREQRDRVSEPFIDLRDRS